MNTSRRNVIAGALYCSASATGFSASASNAALSSMSVPGEEWLVAGAQFASTTEPSRQRRAVSVMGLKQRQPRLIDVDFFPHGFALDPLRPERVASFQKIGPGAAMLDLDTGQVLGSIAPKGTQQFYGHGAFTSDGKLLLSTERDEQARRGLIGIRDGKTLAYLGEFPSFGDSPHDCHLIEEGKVLVVANGDGTVCYIDIRHEKLLEKLTVPNRRFNAGHLLPLPKRRLVTVSAPAKGLGEQELGGISLRLDKKAWSSLSEPQDLTSKMQGEALSVSVSQPAGVIAVTHPAGNLCSFWALSDGAPLGSLALPRPRGVDVSVDGGQFLISYGQHAGLAIVEARSRKLLEESGATAYFSGSHVLNWTRAARKHV